MTARDAESADRSAAVERIQSELTTIARRGTARVRREDETLSFVDQSLLSYIRANPGCRAVDIASHFQLNRSTVSRQLGALAEFGLIAGADADTGRGHALVVTERGRASLDRAAGSVRAALDERLAGWSADELALFAGMLSRYNATDG
ncbi:MarR family winged helix-turn-helix transcriptional regulator [Leifsonia aquatica]|uniref:MarR family winged helix-turn-helix transcriptional regulator n=1 Tax=Leifsonia aquatica TaxID=144185 RepID=UPI000B0E8C72|nr:MarR family winged helix-turn-helix transcriptional regulator [Leifsonia aquatica]